MIPFKHIVLIADGVPDSQGEAFLIENVTLDQDPEYGVSIRLEFNIELNCAGRAKLSKDGNTIVAEGVLVDELVLRDGSKIPTKDFLPAHLCIGGRYGNPTKTVPWSITIQYLGLCACHNTDTRIKPLEMPT